ncbi:MAG: hypothetical protein COU11_04050 [Candidatus Harrisonbacteria bacterium CG10_big_fil_rev_8_21_14_0_10_49_15]|uniref:DUF458 domain-containing protein n=1 Tax=Candidatus Harrisonbacteria bacterium CG10_big_fil_rev_8_21_14_0_10_49_15 TaxID=1974587 RepID=A0A2H0ULJ2_9BACT|nr:MAG: hypothetical protein COU11_04050 [Candidatus Harrisonbacteria bacterium CG10_big_fil_rev_8_21_14_0_10_49_15]
MATRKILDSRLGSTSLTTSRGNDKKTDGDKMSTDYLFHASAGDKLSPAGVASAILEYMAEAPEREYKITLGSDSAGLADKRADFVTAIVVHRVGNGGRYFWRRIFNGAKYHTLRDRMYHEVLLSLDVAHIFLSEAGNLDLPKFGFEIHVDIGENGPTSDMINELTGMIRANNFVAKTKPDSYAASKIADRHTK